LTIQDRSRTSTGLSTHSLVDRDSGRTVVIQYPSFDLKMSASSLYFKADWSHWSAEKMAILLKYLLVFQSLPEAALEEAVGELEKVVEFHTDRVPQAQLPAKVTRITGRIASIEVRPPIVLES
jgi:hypothetical protein